MTMLRKLAQDLWVAERPLPIAVGDLGARMTVLRGASGGLMLHSPVALDAPLRQSLEQCGPVQWVVGPNKAHHLFLGDYSAAYPRAQLCAAPGLADKRKDLRFQHTLGQSLPDGWPGDVHVQLIEGAPLMNEVALLHAPSQTLVLTDLVFNVQHGERNRARVFHWLVGATGRFGPHRLIRLGIRDAAAARQSIDAILAWDFERLIMSHGDVLERGGRTMLEAAFRYLRA